MQGLILAAGMGKRLKELTQNNTKCMVKVNGVTLIERALTALDKLSLKRVVIVVGYEGQKLIDYIGTLNIKTPIEFIDNPIYDKTNNIYSLSLAKKELTEDDTLLLESDLIFEDSVLRALTDDPRPDLALVDKYESWMDGTCLELSEDDSISAFVPGKEFEFQNKNRYFKTVNIYKFSREFSEKQYVPFLEAYSKALGNNEYYEQVLKVIVNLDSSAIKGKRLEGQRWYEIDDIQDLDIAETIFPKSTKEQLDAMQSRYGGYWRYPKLLDFCYLVNPYFPPRKLTEEIKASLETLLTEYPSGMKVNSLLAAKNFGVRREHIVVGNGAAELIKSLMESSLGTVGFIRPTFDEYINRYKIEKSEVFTPDNDDYSYTADDIKNFFGNKDINTLVIVNPDNPSGNYIPKADILSLAEYFGKKGVKLVVDESFSDFADEEDNTLIDEKIMSKYGNLILVKSISKSYGVPGIRLGVLATGDEGLIDRMKKDVAIWNINSFGEFYLQIAEKYKKDYVKALSLFREERKRLYGELSKIKGLRVIPSQANYFMAELKGVTATALTERLLEKHNILIKDLSHKIVRGDRQYIRLAVRNRSDNERLIEAMNAEMK